MDIVCPHCLRTMAVKAARPGRYTTRCTKCSQPFAVTVPADANATPTVSPLPTKKAVGAPAAPPPSAPSGTQATLGGPSADPPAPPPEEKPRRMLGGYQILRQLGRGGMGTVYLAIQTSLARKVALKVMDPQWAEDPLFMARFTREAYAVAQLVHPNVVQIYDIDSDRGLHHFSMEYVPGESLGQLLQRQGKLDVETAVGYILQAARGLKFGHDRGMVHRDVKPDNLLLDGQGLCKVADLGLVKTTDAPEPGKAPGASGPAAPVQLTLARTTVGTPTYMSPEQARNASTVDRRADIYSLGCTLYVLVTGRPPFQGTTVMEVLTKHAAEPVVPPNALVKNVPPSLSAIVLKMVAKRPEERYDNMGQVIRALEDFLSSRGPGRFTPGEKHADLLEDCVRRYNAVPAARLRGPLGLGFLGGCAVLALLCGLLGWWRPLGAFASLAVLSPLCWFIVNGVRQQTYLSARVRELALSTRWADRLVALAGVGLFVLVLWLFQMVGLWLGALVLAASLAVAFDVLIDRSATARQQAQVQRARQLLRNLRLRGLGEDAVREFVCRYSGDRWEAFFEELFGYEAKLAARQRWCRGDQVRRRPAHAAWREPVLRWIDARLLAGRSAKERRHLAQVEQRGLEARGVTAAEARARAEEAAEALVDRAADLRKRRAGLGSLPTVAQLLGMADGPGPVPPSPRQRRNRALHRALDNTFDLFLGPKVRFLLGAFLLAGCIGWMYQNGRLPGQETSKPGGETVQQDNADESGDEIDQENPTQPLSLPRVPAALTDWFDGYNAGVAGLILIASMVFPGWRMAVFAWPAAAVAFVGHRLIIPDLGPMSAETLGMLAGGALLVPGFVLAARAED